jgi:threonine aldolase
MSQPTIDLRSDTVTRPTPGMREAIAAAEVGDDVIDVDPTIRRLEETTAEMLGKEAAVYMPSGSMTNQVAVRVHCKPGDEFICEENCHIYNYEQGAFAQLSGVVARTVLGDAGVLQPQQLAGLIRPDNEHMVRTRLVCLENTHNRASGRIQPYDIVTEICRWAHDAGLRTHLDGARLFNAVVATRIAAGDWAQHFETVSVCFSKGLGAPVGSALAGPQDMIREARRHRKVFGGSMRQAGIIAAGALYGLENHVERLAEDHANAQVLAEAIRDSEGIELVFDPIETNMVIFHVDAEVATASQFVQSLGQQGVLMLAVSPTRIRAVTHLDVNESQVRRAGDILQEVAAQMIAGGSASLVN